MVQESTLLAYLVPRLTSRGEDTATDALAFILNKSPACREALDLLLRDGNFNPGPLTNFQTQVTYEDGSRPDMVGYDQEGGKRLLVESKFWASLLQGQASGYFGQLEEKGPGVLTFIAPGSRIETLWGEIRRQMETGPDGVQLEAVETTEQMRRARISESDKRLMLISWTMLLDRLAGAAPTDSAVASDIQQLRGLAQREDDEAFKPINLEELGPSLARRVQWLNRLIDDVVDGHGVRDSWMSIRGLRATPQRDGYGRYFRFRNDLGEVVQGDLFLCVNFGLWATGGDTPLWLWIGRTVPVSAAQLWSHVRSLKEHGSNGPYDVPIHLTAGVEYESLLSDVVRQIREIGKIVNNQ